MSFNAGTEVRRRTTFDVVFAALSGVVLLSTLVGAIAHYATSFGAWMYDHLSFAIGASYRSVPTAGSTEYDLFHYLSLLQALLCCAAAVSLITRSRSTRPLLTAASVSSLAMLGFTIYEVVHIAQLYRFDSYTIKEGALPILLLGDNYSSSGYLVGAQIQRLLMLAVFVVALVLLARRSPAEAAGATAAAAYQQPSYPAASPAHSGVPAGFYPDPEGKPCERYWDGNAWTAQTRPFMPGGYAPGAASMGAVGQQTTNVLAIISLVSAFFVPILPIITGHISLHQIARTGENGRGLAIAGLVLGYLQLIGFVILMIALLSVRSDPGYGYY